MKITILLLVSILILSGCGPTIIDTPEQTDAEQLSEDVSGQNRIYSNTYCGINSLSIKVEEAHWFTNYCHPDDRAFPFPIFKGDLNGEELAKALCQTEEVKNKIAAKAEAAKCPDECKLKLMEDPGKFFDKSLRTSRRRTGVDIKTDCDDDTIGSTISCYLFSEPFWCVSSEQWERHKPRPSVWDDDGEYEEDVDDWDEDVCPNGTYLLYQCPNICGAKGLSFNKLPTVDDVPDRCCECIEEPEPTPPLAPTPTPTPDPGPEPTPTPTCTTNDYACTSWSPTKCPESKQQTRTCSKKEHVSCTGGVTPATSQSCIYAPPAPCDIDSLTTCKQSCATTYMSCFEACTTVPCGEGCLETDPACADLCLTALEPNCRLACMDSNPGCIDSDFEGIPQVDWE